MNELFFAAYSRIEAQKDDDTLLRKVQSDPEIQLTMMQRQSQPLDVDLTSARTVFANTKSEAQQAANELKHLRQENGDLLQEIAFLENAAAVCKLENGYLKSAIGKLHQAVDQMNLEIEAHDPALEHSSSVEEENGKGFAAAHIRANSSRSKAMRTIEEETNEHSVELRFAHSWSPESKLRVENLAVESESSSQGNRVLGKKGSKLTKVRANKGAALVQTALGHESFCHDRHTAHGSPQQIFLEKKPLSAERDLSRTLLVDFQEKALMPLALSMFAQFSLDLARVPILFPHLQMIIHLILRRLRFRDMEMLLSFMKHSRLLRKVRALQRKWWKNLRQLQRRSRKR